MDLGQFLCRDEAERRRMTDLGRRLRPGVPLMVGAFAVAGLSGVGDYGLLPLIPPAVAILLYLVVWLRNTPRRGRPEFAYAGAVLFAEAMLALALLLGHGPRGYSLVLMAMPVLLAAVFFPRRVVMAIAAISALMMLGVIAAVDMPEVRATPPVSYFGVGLMLVLLFTALLVRDLDEDTRRSAFVDELTGALNRAALAPRLAELTHQTAATGQPVGAIIADIDHFKDVNDSRGHSTGDAVLRTIARRLSDSVGAFEPVYRLGGEEFLILLPGRDSEAATAVAQGMWQAVRRQPLVGLPVTVSFGVAESPAGKPFDFDAVFARADQALYEAKQGGRDRVCTARAVPAPVSVQPLAVEPRAGATRGRARLSPVPPTPESLPGAPIEPLARPVTGELQREHMLDLNRRLTPAFRRYSFAIFVMIAGAIPWFGWQPLVAPVLVAIPYALLTKHAERFRRPTLALGIGWAMFQTSIAVGFACATGAPLFAIALIVLMVPGRCAVFPRIPAIAGAVYTAVLMSAVAFILDAQAVIDNPAILMMPLALLLEACYVGIVVGRSTVGFRGAGIVDELTGLLNRTALNARLLELDASAGTGPSRIALLVADLDHFKAVNDRHGHAVGDEVLLEAAARFRSTLRAFESAYRVGGEEFLVLLPDTDLQAAVGVAERLRAAVAAEPCGGIPVTISVGVCTAETGPGFDFREAFARADAALYAAKRAGRDCVRTDEAAAVAPPVLGAAGAA